VRVLIVDDVEELRRLLRVILEAEAGVTVLEAASGEEALEDLDDHDPDLVIMDHSMPGMTGLECVREIRRRRPGLDIVAFTSMAEGADAFARAGACAHFTKPEVDPLLEWIGRRARAA
jgi:CheY-like chemotaxis protein